MNIKNKRQSRHYKISKKVTGTEKKPRLVVFRSNTNTYAQIINDVEGKTLVAFSTANNSIKKNDSDKTSLKILNASFSGEKLAQLALKKNISYVVFDRGGYKYHGRVKAFAEGARKGGLKF